MTVCPIAPFTLASQNEAPNQEPLCTDGYIALAMLSS